MPSSIPLKPQDALLDVEVKIGEMLSSMPDMYDTSEVEGHGVGSFPASKSGRPGVKSGSNRGRSSWSASSAAFFGQ